MKAELKTKWIEALRSGEFKQGQSALKRRDGSGEMTYCCLGVLRECAGLDWVDTGGEMITPPLAFRAGGYLHEQECIQVGLDAQLSHELAARNDGLDSYRDNRHDFAMLADVIEATVPVE